MRYSQIEDEVITKDLKRCLKKIIIEYPYETFDILDDTIFITPISSSNRSKLEFFMGKKQLLDFLKYSHFARVTNSKWAERNENKMLLRYDFNEDTLGERLASLEILHEKLEHRIRISTRRKARSQEKASKSISIRKQKAAKINGIKSGKARQEQAEVIRHQILNKLYELLAKGEAQHNLVSCLAKQVPLSGRQIRRYLTKEGIKSRIHKLYVQDTIIYFRDRRKYLNIIPYKHFGH